MDQLPADACLAEIRQIWWDASEGGRPPNVWIAEHAPVESPNDFPTTSVVNAWLMDIHGIARRPARDFVRFITVHSGHHWSTGMTAIPAAGVFNDRPGRMHTIGLAVFSPIRDSELIYLHYIWGGTTGRGSMYSFDRKNAILACVQNLWIS